MYYIIHDHTYLLQNLHAYESHCVEIYTSLKKLYRFIMFWQAYMYILNAKLTNLNHILIVS